MTIGDTASAIDGFSIASQDISKRSAAYNCLSSIFIKKGDFNKALSYAEKSLLYNQLGSGGIQLKVLCLRKLGIQDEANNELSKLEMTDPLNHFIRFERYIMNSSPENKALAQKFITNELPQETYLEYALWYFNNGQIADALKTLEVAPINNPIIMIWESYLNHLTGKEQAASALLTEALRINPKLVLPFRLETLIPLAWAQTQSKDWKIKYYTSLIYFGSGATDKGKAIWDDLGQEPDFYPFYIARSRLSEPGSPQSQADIDKAVEFAGNDWQAGLNASKYYVNRGNIPKAVELAKGCYTKYPKNFVLGMQYASTLELNKNYQECINVLKVIQLLPAEGASQGRTLWRKVNDEYAQELMTAGKYKNALQYIDMARLWPENLGSGKPYQVNELTEDNLALECYKKLNDQKSAKMIQDKINNAPVQGPRRQN
jgi:tetratricopeptide (TPR) repeat protein